MNVAPVPNMLTRESGASTIFPAICEIGRVKTDFQIAQIP